MTSAVQQLRVAITTEDHDRLVAFYRDGLGVAVEEQWDNEQGQGTILVMGRATLEVFNEQQAATVDQIEAGRRVTGAIRFALEVPDVNAAVERAVAHGATLVHAVVVTPWGDHNARIQAPDGMQITLFQVMVKP
jgi:lactoylglutathione lyase